MVTRGEDGGLWPNLEFATHSFDNLSTGNNLALRNPFLLLLYIILTKAFRTGTEITLQARTKAVEVG